VVLRVILLINIKKATVSLAHQFNLKVVAEGVETKEMYDESIALDIDYIQGYYLAKPMKMDNLIVWLEEFYKD
jgi:EAL domain-containing protein (putative c-di-GMP-specific phosphodiesterase class I)